MRTFGKAGTVESVSAALKQHEISDAEYAAALAVGQAKAADEFHAQAVRYVPDRDAIEIVTMQNAGFLIPRQWIGAIEDVPVEDLAKLEVWPDGSAIELEDCDIHIGVHGLMTAILPAMLPPQTMAAVFASRGGGATSEAGRCCAQANGRGRPGKAQGTRAAPGPHSRHSSVQRFAGFAPFLLTQRP